MHYYDDIQHPWDDLPEDDFGKVPRNKELHVYEWIESTKSLNFFKKIYSINQAAKDMGIPKTTIVKAVDRFIETPETKTRKRKRVKWQGKEYIFSTSPIKLKAK